jgi:hypothetical protein
MTRVVVVDSDLLGVALARELAYRGARVGMPRVAEHTGFAELRLLAVDAAVVQREAAARDAWRALETESGIELLGRLDALEVGPETTIAATQLATIDTAPGTLLYPVEAARCWPHVRFDGLVVHQRAGRRLHVRRAQQALLRSARRAGVRFGARSAAGADFEIRVSRRATAPRPLELLVGSIPAVAAWPSVVHHAGLPADPDGYVLPGAAVRAEGADALRLRLVGTAAAPAAQLWEYAVRWLPGTIVSGARRCDPAPDGLALAPLRAAELAADLLDSTDRTAERAS